MYAFHEPDAGRHLALFPVCLLLSTVEAEVDKWKGVNGLKWANLRINIGLDME